MIEPDGIADAVTRWAALAPERVALIDDTASLSRADLIRWCRAAAAVLHSAMPAIHAGHVAPEDGPLICALLLPRSWAVPACLIAVRMAGMAFLLLDADDPPARIKAILRKAAPCLLIVTHMAAERWCPSASIAKPLPAPHAVLEPLAVLAMAGRVRLPRDAGHVVFTSGSGGEPKGVILRDAPLLRTVAEQRALLGVDRVTEAASAPSIWALSPAFDASLSDIFCALLGEAPLLVFRHSQTRWRALAAAIAQHHAVRADLAPAVLRVVPPEALGLGAVIFGGERCDPATAERWGRATLALQAYGPTEAAVCAMMARAGPGWRPGLIGRPLAHQIVLLAGTRGTFRVVARDPAAGPDDMAAFNAVTLTPFQDGPVPPLDELEGEIWLAGDAIAIGYLDAPTEEAKRFGTIGGLRVHYSGDRARWRDDALVWIGRTDRQFKLHGNRIAPEEIEAVAGAAWGADCLCAPGRGGLTLALAAGGATTTPEAAAEAVVRHFGTVARPRTTVVLAHWPRRPNGKTDLSAVAQALARCLTDEA